MRADRWGVEWFIFLVYWWSAWRLSDVLAGDEFGDPCVMNAFLGSMPEDLAIELLLLRQLS